jgi:hypothetical protein
MGRSRRNSIANVNYAREFVISYLFIKSESPMYSIRNHTGIVADPSTCRRHCESKHAVIITLFLYLRYLAYKLAGKIQKLVQESRIRFETRWGCGCAEVKGRTIATNN